MSLDAYGYVEIDSSVDRAKLASKIEQQTGLGFTPIPLNELYNFPEDKLPHHEKGVLCFLIGDRPGKSNATYLIDFLDYDPDADIGLPTKGMERLNILVSGIISILEITKSKRILLALTDSSQIESYKSIKLSDTLNTFSCDFEESAPPDCLYEISLDQDRSLA